MKRAMTEMERKVERCCKQIDAEFRQERLERERRKKATVPGTGPARSVTVGPGETAIRSGNPASPATTTGGPPQRFPREDVSRAEFAVNLEAAARAVAGFTNRPVENVKPMLLEDMQDGARRGLSFHAALDEAKRKVQSDIRMGIR